MKIGVLILTIILTCTSFNAFRFKWPYAVLGNDPTKPRFIQSNLNLREKYSLQTHRKQSAKTIYNMKISIIKETDSLEDNPISFDTQCELGKDSIKLFEFGKVRSQISYLDFFFFDGMVLFDDLTFFLKIRTIIYLDIMKNLRPKIELFAKRYGTEDFNRYCSFAFRRKLRDNEKPQLGMIYTSVVFCLNQDYSNEVLSKFSTDFINNYETAVTSETDLNKIQQYRLKQNIMIQYYDRMEKISRENPRLPNFYTSFAKEGLVLNDSKEYNPNQVKNSFRFDQVVQCTGEEASTLKQVINPKIASVFRDDECCISYMVDWNQKGVKNMFCSIYASKWKCRVDIKIFSSTLYAYCLEQQIEKVKKVKKIYNSDLGKAKMYFLERISMISALKSVQELNLESLWDKISYFYKMVEEEKKDVKEDLFASLKAFDNEIADNKKGIVSGCDEIIDVHEKGKQNGNSNKNKSAAKPAALKNDFETINSQQEKQKFSPAMISLNNLEELKLRFCKELKKMLKTDKQLEINFNEKKKQKETEEIEQASKSRKNQILAVVSSVKKIMTEYSIAEIKRVIEIILHYQEILDQIINKKIILTKEIINEILKNSVEDAVRKLRVFVNENFNEKVFKIDYEEDPTHRNTTTVCLPKPSNKTKGGDDKPGEDDDTKKDELPNIIDDPTGYFDESDYHKITGTSINASGKTKITKFSKEIVVPRNIPKISKHKDVNPPFIPGPNHYDPPKPIIPVPIHDDEEPHPIISHENPGMITDSDQDKIKDYVNLDNSNHKNNNNTSNQNNINMGNIINSNSKSLEKFLNDNKGNPIVNNHTIPIPSDNNKINDINNDVNKPKGEGKEDNVNQNKDPNKKPKDGNNNPSGGTDINKHLDDPNKDAGKEKDKNLTNDLNKDNKGENIKNNDDSNKNKHEKDNEKPQDRKNINSDSITPRKPRNDHSDFTEHDSLNEEKSKDPKTPNDPIHPIPNHIEENKDKDNHNINDPKIPTNNNNKDVTTDKHNDKEKGPGGFGKTDPSKGDKEIKNPSGHEKDNEKPQDRKNINSDSITPRKPRNDHSDFTEHDSLNEEKSKDHKTPNDPIHPIPNHIEENKDKDNHNINDPKIPTNNNNKDVTTDRHNDKEKGPGGFGKTDPSKGDKEIKNPSGKDVENDPNMNKDKGPGPSNQDNKDKSKTENNNNHKDLEKNLHVFSTSITRHIGDPTKRPVEIGHIYKNPVDPKSAKKLLTAVEEINAELAQEMIKKRKLKKLY